VPFALAVGVYQSMPAQISPCMADFSWEWYLRYRVRDAAVAVCRDDRALLQEQADCSRCATLTDAEVLDACLMRGLPLEDLSADDMRQSLTNHLRMIKSVQPTDTVKDESFGLFTLHLTILRDYYKKAQ
jgi:hypothetical protein